MYTVVCPDTARCRANPMSSSNCRVADCIVFDALIPFIYGRLNAVSIPNIAITTSISNNVNPCRPCRPGTLTRRFPSPG